jgi:hypothetical protein
MSPETGSGRWPAFNLCNHLAIGKAPAVVLSIEDTSQDEKVPRVLSIEEPLKIEEVFNRQPRRYLDMKEFSAKSGSHIGYRRATLALTILAALFVSVLQLRAQKPYQPGTRAQQIPAKNMTTMPALEPVATKALRIMSDQLRTATSLSFTASIMREEPGTNGQMLDFFKHITVQMQRPDKMRLEVRSDTSDVTLWYDGKNVTLMPATAQMYTTIPAPPTIDQTLAMLKDKLQAHTQLIPFLSSDPYAVLVDGLRSANEIGIVKVGNEQLLHLAFTEPDADWQLWLTGPNQVLPHRVAVIYKNIAGQPRVNIEFSNWRLNPEIPRDAFVFSKPQGAVEASLNAVRPRTTKQGGSAQ